VAIDTPVYLVFSAAMATSTVSVNVSPVPVGSRLDLWSADRKTLSIGWSVGVQAGHTYQVTIASGATDQAGTPLAGTLSFSFTTVPPIPPTIVGITPVSGTSGISRQTQIVITFDHFMDTTSVEAAVSLSPPPGGALTPVWSGGGDTLTLTPTVSLAWNTLYTLSVTTGARDLDGTPLASIFSATFTTEIPPTPVIVAAGVVPAAGSSGIATATQISIPFSEPMDHPSVEAAFGLRSGSGPIAGSFSWSGETLIFTPSAPLSYAVLHTISVTSSAHSLAGATLGAPWSSTFTTIAAPVPAVLASSIPVAGAVGVALNSSVSLTFSKAMNTGTVNVTMSPVPLGTLNAVWSNGNKTLSLTWSIGLQPGIVYQASVDAAARDIDGLALNGTPIFQFQTGTITAPQVTSMIPAAGATDVIRSTTFQITFDRQMDQIPTAAAISLAPNPGGSTTPAWSLDGLTLTLTRSTPLDFDTQYSLTAGVGAHDLSMVPLSAPVTVSFRTEVRPAIISANCFPAADATGVATDAVLLVAFSKPMNTSSTGTAFSLLDGITPVNGGVSWSGNTLHFTPPAAGWPASRTLQIQVTTAASDLRGNTLAAPFTRQFTTQRLYGSIWTETIQNDPSGSQFSTRTGHSVVAFRGAIYLIGGFDGDYLNDVWKSTNGVSWTNVLANNTTPPATQFPGRAFHACVVDDTGKLWLTGGENLDVTSSPQVLDDVWSTTDVITWSRVSASAAYWARRGHSMISTPGKLWMIGGETVDPSNLPVLLDDVWTASTTSGGIWTEKVGTVSFFPRKDAAAAYFGGRLWIWAGYGTNALGVTGPLNDVWSSVDGGFWSRAVENASYTPRSSPGFAIHAGRVWLAAGLGRVNGWDVYHNDVWNSSDGVEWRLVREEGPETSDRFSTRSSCGLVETGGALYLVGGEDATGYRNDVRKAQ
ncbi:MAG: Ig-like domain-containing protein, partial [Candidatus Riflebacteria bacterium]|nr:Ig-like domain-containing protein [Candidatus Riflebacteria bacterium]